MWDTYYLSQKDDADLVAPTPRVPYCLLGPLLKQQIYVSAQQNSKERSPQLVYSKKFGMDTNASMMLIMLSAPMDPLLYDYI